MRLPDPVRACNTLVCGVLSLGSLSHTIAVALRKLPRYLLTDLGLMDVANGINALGHVVGDTELQSCPFVYKSGKRIVVKTLPGYKHAYGMCINDAGQVTGMAFSVIIEEYSSTEYRAFLWDGHQMSDLGTLGGKESAASCLNNHSQVVGWAYTGKTYYLSNGLSATYPVGHAFLWQHGEMQDLGTLGGTLSRANGINDKGQIVGVAQTKQGTYHAFLWQQGNMQDLGWEGDSNEFGYLARYGAASAINEKGQIVGNREGRAVLWQQGKLIRIGRLNPAFGKSYAFAINNQGQIVGTSTSRSWENNDGYLPQLAEHAFLCMNGKMYDLNNLVRDRKDWVLKSATGINDRGEIVGIAEKGTMEQTEAHAFLLTPISTVH